MECLQRCEERFDAKKAPRWERVKEYGMGQRELVKLAEIQEDGGKRGQEAG